MYLLKYRWFLLFFIMLLLLSGCSTAQKKQIYAEQGSINLTGWDFDKDGIVMLDGQWELYWKQFLNYEELQEKKPDLYATVPSTWNKYSMDGKSLPGQGYATYRLHIKASLPEDTMMGLRVYAFSSAYKLYINEKLIASNGEIGTKAEDEAGEYKPQAVLFNTPAKEFDIIVQVSNFQYARGGFWYGVSFGTAGGIIGLNDIIMGKEIFLIGALIIISLFYLTVYILRREFKYSLYFSCLCLFMAIALDMVGQYILVRIIPGIVLNTVIFIWYTSTTWVLFFLILYVHELFKSRFSGLVMRIYLGISIVFELVYIFTSPTFYTRFADVSNLIEIAGALCTVIMVAIGIKKGCKDAWLNIASMLIVLVTYIHDILFWTNRIKSSFGEIIYLGLFLFIFLQMVIQAKRIRMYHDHKTAAELSFLQAQIKPHFLYNAINTFISISRYDTEQARELLSSFSNYLRRSFDFKDLSQFVPLKSEIELAKAYVRIEKARFEERLEVYFDACDDLEVKVPMLVLQPVIENAVNHGVLPKPEGGRIEVLIKMEGKLLKFCVKDNGVGMDLEKSTDVLKRGFGSGVGLSNINSRLRKLFGKGLQIKSKPGVGTEVTWCIPI